MLTPLKRSITIALLLAALILTLEMFVLSAVAAAPTAKPSWQYKYKVWMPKHWQNLAACESGSNPPNWTHNSGTYEGAFGFYYGSWDSFKLPGYPSAAYLATPWQQWKVARRIAARYGIASPWGCWRGPHHSWVRAGKPEYGTYS